MAMAASGHRYEPNISGTILMRTDRIYVPMRFNAVKTILALVLVYGVYAGIYLASPAPPYAVTISFALFFVFGLVIWYVGFWYGKSRPKRQKLNRDAQTDKLNPNQRSSE
ncbi:hypothetical protein [Halegenticoccus tardaugens]|uniref:hypothetical protein n=1 Tax=Halegenticoccus tardaugens TaxID=2071624 RepID=UPI00100ABAA4|nr:hypothetical protein [Halegenticoccus tardaugens]